VTPAPPAQVVATFYSMLVDEVSDAGYSEDERALMSDNVAYYGRFLRPETRPYALSAVVRNISRAVTYFGIPTERRLRILDLGCGLGMNSVVLASYGADVVGVDVDPRCTALAQKRVQYFEGRLGRPLHIGFVTADFRDYDAGPEGFDAVFSMSAFSHMLPMPETVAHIASLLRRHGRVFIWDKNPSYLGRRWSAYGALQATPEQVRGAFRRHGIVADELTGGVAVPHQLWRGGIADRLCSTVERLLVHSIWLSFSYVLAAKRATEAY